MGEESKLTRSFDRLRSIVKKGKFKKEKSDNEQNRKLEEMVRQVVQQQQQQHQLQLQQQVKSLRIVENVL